MINFGNIKSYPTFSSYQRLKTIKSKELTERKNLKKGTIKSYKDYLDKKNGFKCCNGKAVHEQCCYCLKWKNSLNENCLDVFSKYNCFPCPKWRNVLRVPNVWKSIHVSNKGQNISAIETENAGEIYISSNGGDTWVDSGVRTGSSYGLWEDIVGTNSGTIYYVAASDNKIYTLTRNSSNEYSIETKTTLTDATIKLAMNLNGDKIFTAYNATNKQEIGKIIDATNHEEVSGTDFPTADRDANETWLAIETDDEGKNIVAINSTRIHISKDSGGTFEKMINDVPDGTYINTTISGDGEQIIIIALYAGNKKLWITRRTDGFDVNSIFSKFEEITNNDDDFINEWEFVKSSENGSYIVASTTDGQVWLSSDYGNSWDNIKTFAGVIKDISIGIDDTNNKLRLVVAENKNLWSYTINI